ncbi:nitrate/nitrite transporter [Chloroflexota bacterium]
MVDKSQPQNQWFVLIIATLILVGAIGIPFSAMPVLFSRIIQDLQLTLAQMGMIWGVLPLGGAIAAIPGGLLGDRLDTRKFIGVGCFVIAVISGLRGISGNYATLIIFMFLCGIAITAVIPNFTKVVSLFFPPRQLGLAIGILNSGVNIGGILTTALGATVILPLVGTWRNVLFLYSAIGITLGIIWLLAIREIKQNQMVTDTDSIARKDSVRKTLGRVLRVKDMRLLMIASMLLAGSFLALLGYMPIYLENTGVPKSTGDMISSTIFVAGILGSLVIPTLSDRIGSRKRVLIVCTAVIGISIFLLSISDTKFFWILVPIIGATFMGAIAVSLVIPLELKEIGPTYGASAAGLLIASHNIGGFIWPTIGGKLAEVNQSWPFIFWAILVFAATTCFFFIGETSYKQSSVR